MSSTKEGKPPIAMNVKKEAINASTEHLARMELLVYPILMYMYPSPTANVIRSRAKIDNSARRQQAQATEEAENFAAGLMNGRNDGSVLACQAPNFAHHVVGSGTVQTAGWLVEEEKFGAGENLQANAHSPFLSTAYPFAPPPSSYSGVHGVLQPHLLYSGVRYLLLLRSGQRARELQLRGIVHGLAHR
nr:Os10g0163300 [Ipomoea batatas]